MTTVYSARNTPSIVEVPIHSVVPSPLNPRKHFEEAALNELAESIRTHGIQQPIVVRMVDPYLDEDEFHIIMGERRWRAARLAGLTMVPVIVREGIDDAQHLELAIHENIKRSDLNPIEEAMAFRQLTEIGGLKQTEIAGKLGRSQENVSNRIRLLKLPEDAQKVIAEGSLSPSHGLALLPHMNKGEAAVTHMAQYLAKNHVPLSILEKGIPWSVVSSLQDERLAVPLWGNIPFHSTCEKCPLNACFKVEGATLCFRPDHYRDLMEEYQNTVKTNAVTTRSGDDGVQADLPRWDWSSMQQVVGETPDGCDEHCECRGKALFGAGDITVCLNKDRYQKLAKEQEERIKAERTERFAAHLRVTIEPTTPFLPVDEILRFLACRIIEEHCDSISKVQAAGIGQGIPDDMFYTASEEGPDGYSLRESVRRGIDAHELARLAAGIIVLDSLGTRENAPDEDVRWDYLISAFEPPTSEATETCPDCSLPVGECMCKEVHQREAATNWAIEDGMVIASKRVPSLQYKVRGRSDMDPDIVIIEDLTSSDKGELYDIGEIDIREKFVPVPTEESK